MPEGKGGHKYVVDLVDNLTGWVKARALKKLKSECIAEFLFNVMACFRCIFQLTCDNSSEFFRVMEVLMEKYKVPVVRILAYNLQANGKIERTHWMYMDSIWKVCEGKTLEWTSWLNYALWADRITAKKNTGYSLYYLLYGQHPVLPFNVEDQTFHVWDWPGTHDTVSLLALRMKHQRGT